MANGPVVHRPSLGDWYTLPRPPGRFQGCACRFGLDMPHKRDLLNRFAPLTENYLNGYTVKTYISLPGDPVLGRL